MKIEAGKVLENVVQGFVKGAGVDSLLWAASAYIPQLKEESPIRVPGWHPPYPEAKTHWDDLITIATSAGVVIYGVTKKKTDTVIEGVAMLIGGWLVSQFQPLPVQPWSSAAAKSKSYKYPSAITTTYACETCDLVKVD